MAVDTDELQRQIGEVRLLAEEALDKFPIRSTTTPGASKERHIHDLGKHPGGVIAARVHNSAAISVSNVTQTVLTFDSERFDTDTIHSTSSNTGRLTATTAGKYYITGTVEWASSPSQGNIAIRLNGATSIAASVVVADYRNMVISTLYDLAATDYVELLVRQSSGGAINITANSNFSPEFAMARVGASGTVAGGAPGTDHGTLNGLADDDHSLYLLAAGSRAGSTGGAQDFGATGIKADVVAESTAAAGVTVDGLLIKDGSSVGADDLWAAQGDLVKGTGNDAADILSIGADHTVLASNGTDPAWSAIPPLAGIADTGDTTRITLSTSGNEVKVTGDFEAATINGSASAFGALTLDSTSNATKFRIQIPSSPLSFDDISTPSLGPASGVTLLYAKNGVMQATSDVGGVDLEYVVGSQIGWTFAQGQVGGFTPAGATWDAGFYGLIAEVTSAGTPTLGISSVGRKIINTTGTTSGNDAGWFTDNIIERDALPYFLTMFSLDSTANVRMFIGWTDQTLVTMVGADEPAGEYIGFQYSASRGDTKWRVIRRSAAADTYNFTDLEDVDTSAHYLKITNPSNTAWVFQVLSSALVSESAGSVSSAQAPLGTVALKFVNGIETETTAAKVLNTFHGFFMLNK